MNRVYEFGGFRLSATRRLLFSAAGDPLPIKAKVLDTLLYFVEHPGVVLDKSTLMRAVWGDSVVEENGLNQHVSTLRRVLGERPGENRFIATVPGRGYQFVASVRAYSEEVERVVTPTAGAGLNGRRDRALDWRIAIAGSTLGTVVAAGLVWQLTRFDVSEAVSRRSAAESPVEDPSAGLEERRGSASPAAYALYREARTAWLAGTSPATDARARAMLDRAIELDPGFSRAWGLKARIYAQRFVNSMNGAPLYPAERDNVLQLVREYADRALELDASDPEALAARRLIDIFTWHWSSFEEPLGPAAELEARLHQIWILCWLGECSEAVRIGEKVAELNPNDVDAHFGLGVVYAYSGHRTASIRSLSRALELAAGNPLGRIWLAYNEIAIGDDENALSNLALVEQLLGDNPPLVMLPELAYSYSRLHRDADARRLFEAIEATADDPRIGTGTRAMAYLAIGDETQALKWLEAAAAKARKHEVDPGFHHLMNLKMNFLADPRLEAPPFDQALSRIRGD